jgi:hypothetical protein
VIDRGDGKIQIRKPQDDGTTTIHDISSVDELLVLLGWTFKCTDCPRHGMEDGIQGENDPQTQVLKVSCGCTVRAYREPSLVELHGPLLPVSRTESSYDAAEWDGDLSVRVAASRRRRCPRREGGETVKMAHAVRRGRGAIGVRLPNA